MPLFDGQYALFRLLGIPTAISSAANQCYVNESYLLVSCIPFGGTWKRSQDAAVVIAKVVIYYKLRALHQYLKI